MSSFERYMKLAIFSPQPSSRLERLLGNERFFSHDVLFSYCIAASYRTHPQAMANCCQFQHTGKGMTIPIIDAGFARLSHTAPAETTHRAVFSRFYSAIFNRFTSQP